MELDRIYRDDNLNFLSRLSGSGVQIDLVLTDPPYNVGKDFGNDSDRQADQEYLNFMEARSRIVRAALAPLGNVICFASQKYVAHVQILLERHDLHFQRLMIWHYKNGMSRQERSPVTEFEPFLWHTANPKEWVYNGDDVRVPYKSDRVKTPVYKKNKAGEVKAWMPNPLGAKRGDVWEYPTLAGKLYEDERTEHPSQKPESLITDLIKAFCPKKEGKYDGVVADIFGGSGTVPVCCELLNRQGHNIRWVACELEQKWVDVSNARIDRLNRICDDSIL